MFLDHCYAFGLLLKPSSLKKKFLKEGDPSWPIFAPPWIRPWTDLAAKTTTLVRDLEYFIHTKFHQNPSSGSGEEIKNVNSLTDGRTTDGRQTTRGAFGSCALKILWVSFNAKQNILKFWQFYIYCKSSFIFMYFIFNFVFHIHLWVHQDAKINNIFF